MRVLNTIKSSCSRSCWLLFLAISSLAGCGDSPRVVETDVPEAQSRLMAINLAYMRFLEQQGRPPSNEQELRSQFSEGNPDEILRSPRDGQPFVICYGVNIFGDLPWAKSTPVLAYEQQGDGSRWVLSIPGGVFELDEAEFQKASFPPGHTVQ